MAPAAVACERQEEAHGYVSFTAQLIDDDDGRLFLQYLRHGGVDLFVPLLQEIGRRSKAPVSQRVQHDLTGSTLAGARLSVKGGEKVDHCGGGIVYHRHDETGSIGNRAGSGQEQGSASPE